MSDNVLLSTTLLIGTKLASSFHSGITSAKAGVLSVGNEIKTLENRQKDLNKTIIEQQQLGDKGNRLTLRYALEERAAVEMEIEEIKKKRKQQQESLALLDKNNAKIKELRGSLLKLSAAGAALFAVPTKNAVEFDDQMQLLSTQGHITQSEIEKLKKTTLEFSKDSSHDIGDVTGALKVLIKDQHSAADSGKALGAISDLSLATGLHSMTEAAKIATGVMSEFGLSTKDTSMIADTLVNATQGSSGALQDWATALATVGADAKAANLSFQDTNTIFATLSNAGINASQSATALNGMLDGIVRPTAKIKAALDSLGISLSDKTGKLRPFNDVLRDLSKSMKGLSEEGQNEVLRKIFSSNTTAAKVLMKSIGDGSFDKLAEKIRKLGAAHKEAERQDKALGEQTEILKNSMNSLSIGIGSAFTPILNVAVKALRSIVDVFVDFSLDFPIATKVITLTVAGLILFRSAVVAGRIAMLLFNNSLIMGVLGMGKTSLAVRILSATFTKMGVIFRTVAPFVLVGVKGIGGAFLKLGAIFRALIPFLITGIRAVGAAFLTNPIGIAIAAIGVAAFLLIKYWKPVKAFFVNFWHAIKAIWNADIKFFTDKIDWIVEKYKAVKNFFGFGDKSDSAQTQVVKRIDASRVPLSGNSSKNYTDNSEYHFQINATAGQNPQEIARAVSQHLAQQKRIAQASRMDDFAFAGGD